jgi:hypothetical protein
MGAGITFSISLCPVELAILDRNKELLSSGIYFLMKSLADA